MDVNKENYEELVLDYIEGNLSTELAESMTLFLKENPQIENEIHDLDKYVVPISNEVYPLKGTLYKPESKSPVLPLFFTGIAASLALLFGVLYFMQISNQQEQTTALQITDELQTANKVQAKHKTNESVKQMAETIAPAPAPAKRTVTKRTVTKQRITAEPKPVKQPVNEKQTTTQLAKAIVSPPVSNKTFEKVSKTQSITSTQNSKQKLSPTEPKANLRVSTVELKTQPHSKTCNDPAHNHNLHHQSLQASINQRPNHQQKNPVFTKVLQQPTGLTAQKNNSNDGFEIEVIPEEDSFTSVTKQENNNQDTSIGFMANRETILDIIPTNKNEIKKAILPKSFGFGIKKEKK